MSLKDDIKREFKLFMSWDKPKRQRLLHHKISTKGSIEVNRKNKKRKKK